MLSKNIIICGGEINIEKMTANLYQVNRDKYTQYLNSPIIFNLNDNLKSKIINLEKKLLFPKFEFKNSNICFLIDNIYICIGERKEKTIEINNIYEHIIMPKNENENIFCI